MSFSGDVKEELSYRFTGSRHCQIAELTAILILCGQITRDPYGGFSIKIVTENLRVARKYFTLLEKAFNIECSFRVRQRKTVRKTRIYLLKTGRHEETEKILKAAKLLSGNEVLTGENFLTANHLVIQMECCKRAFLRGVFLVCGSVNDPKTSYHLEIVADTMEWARFLTDLICGFGVEARIAVRKKNFVVYVKEADGISVLLNLMGAHVSLMEFENRRILKEISNTVNRQVNCETANLNKTVTSSMRQIEDIRYIEQVAGLSSLPPGLEETARARLEFPELTLKELGQKLVPPVGKSGVNHRLRRISEIAEELRGA